MKLTRRKVVAAVGLFLATAVAVALLRSGGSGSAEQRFQQGLMAAQQRHNHRQALEYFDEAIRRRPDWVEALTARAESRLELDWFDGADSDLQRARMLAPSDVRVQMLEVQLLKRRALAAIEDTGQVLKPTDFDRATVDLEAARRAASQLAAARPTDAEAHSLLGEVLVAQALKARSHIFYVSRTRLQDAAKLHDEAGQVAARRQIEEARAQADEATRQAVASFTRAIALDPNVELAEPRTRLGLIHYNDGDYAQALAVLEPLLRKFPAHPRAGLLAAEVYKRLKQYDAAIRVLEPLRADRDTWAEATTKAAEILNEKGDYARAEELAASVLARQRRHVWAGYHHASALLFQRKYAEALAGLQRAIQAPRLADDPTVQYRLAVALMGCGQLQQAQSVLHKVVRLSPGFAAAHVNLALIHFATGWFQEALEEAQAALAIEPDNAAAHDIAGKAYLKLNQPSAARRHFEVSPATEEPDSPEYNKALLFATMGQFDQALASCQKALRQNPGHFQAAVLLADTLWRQGNATEAIAQYEKLLTQFTGATETARILTALVEIYTSATHRDLDKARPLAERLRATHPLAGEYHLATIAALAGEHSRALAAWQKIAANPEVDKRTRSLACLNQARILFFTEQYAQAEEAYRQAVALDVDAFSAHLEMGRLNRRRDRRPEAAENLSRASAALNTARGKVQERIALVEEWLALGHPDKALAECEKALKLEPAETRLHLLQAQVLVQMGQAPEAVARLERLAGRLPKDTAVRLALAQIHEDVRHDPAEAERQYRQILKEQPGQTAASVRLAYNLMRRGRRAEAQPLLQALATEHPKDPAVREALATVLAAGGDWPGAANQFTELLNQAAGDEALVIEAHKGLIRLYVTAGRFDEALPHYQEVLHRRPGSRLRLGYAQVLGLTGRFEEAAEQYAIFGRHDPANVPSAQIGQAELLAVRGWYAEAAQLLETLVDKNPQHLGWRVRLAELYHRLGATEKADAHVAAVLEADPDNATALDLSLRHKRAQGQAVIEELERRVQNAPTNRLVLGQLYRLYMDHRQYDQAAELSLKATAAFPTSATWWMRCGDALLMQGKKARGVNALRQAHQLQPKDPRPVELLGVHLLRLDDAETAATVLTSGQEALPGSAAIPMLAAAAWLQVDKLHSAGAACEAAIGIASQTMATLAEAGHFSDAARLKAFIEGAYIQLAFVKTCLGQVSEAVAICTDPQKVQPETGALVAETLRRASARPEEVRVLARQLAKAVAMLTYGRGADAEAAARQALAIAPQSLVVHNVWARALLAQDKAREALEVYRRMAALSPGTAAIHRQIGDLYRTGPPGVRDLAKAAEAYRAAVSAAGAADEAVVLELLAQEALALDEAGRRAEAEKAYREVLRRSGGKSYLAANNLAWLLAAEADPARLQEAREWAQRAYEQVPRHATWRRAVENTLGWILYLQGRHAEALELLKRAIIGNADKWQYHYHLGLAYDRTGHKAEALVHLRLALQLGDQFPQRAEVESAVRRLASG